MRVFAFALSVLAIGFNGNGAYGLFQPYRITSERALALLSVAVIARLCLAYPRVLRRGEGANLIETIKYRNARGTWYVRLAVVMPDHVHLVVWFPDVEKHVQTIISKWKEWSAKALKIDWQRDFFEHRLRRDESARQKADYILFNPVRAGLVSKPEDWPFVFIPEQ